MIVWYCRISGVEASITCGNQRGIILVPYPRERAAQRMAQHPKRIAPGREVEIKLRIKERGRLLRRLTQLKAKRQAPRVHEMNALYDTSDGALARRAQLVRIRVEYAPGGGKPKNVVLTYKGPLGAKKPGRRDARYKIRHEREVGIADDRAMASILEAMGLTPWFRYEKYRSTYRLPGLVSLKVEFDETPMGEFLELEGPSREIDRGAKMLGFAAADYIVRSYGSLWMEHAGLGQGEPKPGRGLRDMLFSK